MSETDGGRKLWLTKKRKRWAADRAAAAKAHQLRTMQLVTVRQCETNVKEIWPRLPSVTANLIVFLAAEDESLNLALRADGYDPQELFCSSLAK